MSLNVIDIGKDQAGINLAAVPCDAVIVGVCDAFTNNPYADQEYQGARKAGRRVGVYQFYRNNPAEADYFVTQIRGYIGQAVIIVDAETDAANMVAATLEACRRIEAQTGVRPMIYAPPYLLNKYNWQPCVSAGYALWLPAYIAGYDPIYGFNPPPGLLPPKWWGACAMWQFTSTGILPGWAGYLDLSIFAGTGAAWDAFTQSTQEDTLSAADVAAINAHTDAVAADIKTYIAAFCLYGYQTGGAQHPGIAPVVEENQRRLTAAANAATANATATATGITGILTNVATVNTGVTALAAQKATLPVVLTDAQVAQIRDSIIASVPAANLAALKDQLNKE